MNDKQYTILVADSVANIVNQVNEMIKQGWIPLGGVSTLGTNEGVRWIQTIVRQNL